MCDVTDQQRVLLLCRAFIAASAGYTTSHLDYFCAKIRLRFESVELGLAVDMTVTLGSVEVLLRRVTAHNTVMRLNLDSSR